MNDLPLPTTAVKRNFLMFCGIFIAGLCAISFVGNLVAPRMPKPEPVVEAAPSGHPIIVGTSGCTDRKVYSRIRGMLRAGDREAANSIFTREDCRNFPKDVRVRIEDRDSWDGVACVAEFGHPGDCYWIWNGALKR